MVSDKKVYSGTTQQWHWVELRNHHKLSLAIHNSAEMRALLAQCPHLTLVLPCSHNLFSHACARWSGQLLIHADRSGGNYLPQRGHNDWACILWAHYLPSLFHFHFPVNTTPIPASDNNKPHTNKSSSHRELSASKVKTNRRCETWDYNKRWFPATNKCCLRL